MINTLKFVVGLLAELAKILGYVALQGRGRSGEQPRRLRTVAPTAAATPLRPAA